MGICDGQCSRKNTKANFGQTKKSSCNAAVYDEIGRYPLNINRYIRIVKYWLRIINTDIILRTVINTCLNDARNGRVNWFSEVKHLL